MLFQIWLIQHIWHDLQIYAVIIKSKTEIQLSTLHMFPNLCAQEATVSNIWYCGLLKKAALI